MTRWSCYSRVGQRLIPTLMTPCFLIRSLHGSWPAMKPRLCCTLVYQTTIPIIMTMLTSHDHYHQVLTLTLVYRSLPKLGSLNFATDFSLTQVHFILTQVHFIFIIKPCEIKNMKICADHIPSSLGRLFPLWPRAILWQGTLANIANIAQYCHHPLLPLHHP